MISLKELFDRDNVPFPEWLENDLIKEDWMDSTYLKGDDIHKWELNSSIGFQSITLENERYNFIAYDLDNNVLFEMESTPTETMIT